MEHLRTCRICREQGHHLVKYSARQYAHARCFLVRYGVKGLEQLDLDALLWFPAGVAAEHGALAKLIELVRQAR